MRFLLTLALLLTLPLAAPAAELHLSPSGNDASGDGSASAPFATLARTMEAVQAGDTLILAQGEYQAALSIRVPGLTITSEPGARAVLTASITDEDEDTCLYVKAEASGLTLRNLEITGGYYYAVMLESTWDWGDPVKTAASNVLIEDCLIHDTGRDCIKITPAADNVTIRRCEIYNSGRRDDGNAEGIDNVNGDNMLVQDCHIHDIATNGVYFKGGAQGCVIERCVIERCGEMGIGVGFDTSPEWFDTEVNPELFESIDGVVRNNLIRDTRYAGIGIYASLRPRVYHNTVVDAASEGHSPLYFGLAYHDWEDGVPRPASVQPDVRNNIFTLAQGSGQSLVEIRYSDDLGGMSALDGAALLDGNCYFAPKASARFTDLRPGSEFEGDLTGWRNHMHSDAASMVADPLLDQSLHLTPGSPCIDAGVPLDDPAGDMDGDPRDARPDMGADEVM